MSNKKLTVLAALCGGLMMGCAADLDDADLALGEGPAANADAHGDHVELRSTQQDLRANGARPLLTLMLHAPAAATFPLTDAQYDARIYGTGFPSLNGYYNAVSRNTARFTRAGMQHIRMPANSADLDRRAGVVAGEEGNRSWAKRARVLAADGGFRFQDYDTNRDGTVSGDELSIVIFGTGAVDAGNTRDVGCARLNNVDVCPTFAVMGTSPSMSLLAHEMAHEAYDFADIYGRWNLECLSDYASLMSCSRSTGDDRVFYPDPWHRSYAGWGQVSTSNSAAASGSVKLSAASEYTRGGAGMDSHIIVRNKPGVVENLLIEYRKPTGYDRDTPLNGVTFWYTQAGQPAAFGSLSMVPSLNDPSTQINANFVLAPTVVNCMGSAGSTASRGVSRSVAFGAQYRMAWADGSDVGYLFSVGTPAADGTVTVSWTKSNAMAFCPENSRDLVVTNTNLPYFGAMRNQVLTVGATTRNQSGAAAASTRTGFYLSTDAVKSTGDLFLASIPVGALSGNTQVVSNLNVTIPSNLPNGEYWLIACADFAGEVPETNETNNCKASGNSMLILL